MTALVPIFIRDMELSVRTANCIANNYSKDMTLADICNRPASELLRMPNFGRKSLAELRDVAIANRHTPHPTWLWTRAEGRVVEVNQTREAEPVTSRHSLFSSDEHLAFYRRVLIDHGYRVISPSSVERICRIIDIGHDA